MANRRRPTLSPNDGLFPQDIRDLNEEFYAMRPYAYFLRQTELLALLADRSGELDSLLREGAKFGRTRIRLTESDGGPSEREREEDRERFLIAQTEVLVHHTAETLLRLYLAHETRAESPWLEIASNRRFAEFKRTVRGLANDLNRPEGRRNLMYVFCATNDRTDITPTPTEEVWEARRRNISAWLVWFAELFLDANVYNAAKHGFALGAGASRVEIGTHGDIAPIGRGGPALHYVEEVRGDDGPQWARTIRWVNFDTAVHAVHMAAKLMDSVLDVGAARRIGRRLETMNRLDYPDLNAVLRAAAPDTAITFEAATVGMAYRRDRRPATRR